eukprot:TRINITY_DN8741_c0_g1_i1.p2 TRINITY_DN8741_c0_g1~~TRINITY_DN8741_c0_g1_i1.p2  ORF type:complete len:129 (+),score=22.60 TRINITY_DN8741_c0_g1_i1:76-462(+)
MSLKSLRVMAYDQDLRRKVWPSERTVDWVGIVLLHCLFAVALAGVANFVLFGSPYTASQAVSCVAAEDAGYTWSGLLQDCRQLASFVLGAATCSFIMGDTKESSSTSDAGDEEDYGVLKLNMQVVSFL